MQAGAIALLKAMKRPDRHGPDECYQDASGSEKGDGMSAQKWAVYYGGGGGIQVLGLQQPCEGQAFYAPFFKAVPARSEFSLGITPPRHTTNLCGGDLQTHSPGHGPGNVAVVRTRGYHKARVRPGPKLDVSDELPLVEFPRATRSHMYDTRLLSSSSRH